LAEKDEFAYRRNAWQFTALGRHSFLSMVFVSWHCGRGSERGIGFWEVVCLIVMVVIGLGVCLLLSILAVLGSQVVSVMETTSRGCRGKVSG
jgi:hypothetical protein